VYTKHHDNRIHIINASGKDLANRNDAEFVLSQDYKQNTELFIRLDAMSDSTQQFQDRTL
jgi:hypothetical protein